MKKIPQSAACSLRICQFNGNLLRSGQDRRKIKRNHGNPGTFGASGFERHDCYDLRDGLPEKKSQEKIRLSFFPERKPGKKIHDGEKDFFNHELDEKYSRCYRIQNLRCGMEKDHNQIEKRECHIRTDL